MYRNKIRSLTFPAVLSSSLLIYNAECEKDRGELVLATAQRLKHGLTMDHLRLSQTTVDGIEVYIPKGNFGRFSKEGLSVARVAATEIRCNYKEIITLWQDQLHRKDWDASCSTVVPVKPNDQTSVESENTQLSHFVERSAFFIPSRDYVIHVMEPYPGDLIS